MSKYRCPVCGATHKDLPTHCRLCGQDMSGTSTIPAYAGGARQAAQKKSGLGPLFVIAIVGVIAIAALALVMGLTGSNDFIDNIREKVPGLEPRGEDGWTTLDDPSGGFVAEMPEEREKKFVAFAPAANGRLDQWSSTIGGETELTISYGAITAPAGQSATATLVSLADTWAATIGAQVDESAETTFRGYPAIDLSLRDLTYGGEDATARAMIMLEGDTVYVIQSLSIYPDQPQFGRLVNSFVLTS